MTFQTVIYDNLTKEIILVLPGQYIRSRNQLKSLTADRDASSISFLYFKYPFPIITTAFSLRSYSMDTSMTVIDDKGQPAFIQSWSRDLFKAISTSNKINVYFEGGMGDMFMEAAAVATARIQYPGVEFIPFVNEAFISIASLVDGLNPKPYTIGRGPKVSSGNNILFNPKLEVDPRAGMMGKSSLYGIFLGLNSVEYTTKIKTSSLDKKVISTFYEKLLIDEFDNVAIIHPFSASGHAKDMPTDLIFKIAALYSGDDQSKIFVIGNNLDKFVQSDKIINLCGKTSWLETLFLVMRANNLYCVDSSVAHMAYCLNVPCHRFWSITSPPTIFGDPWSGLDHDFSWIPEKVSLHSNM